MKAAVIALTQKGAELALKIGYALDADVYVKEVGDDFRKLVERLFPRYEGLVFIMACGIVVRSIAPYLKSKTEDPAVVVVDEKGHYAISLLSGHLGGANRLAGKVSAITGGVPVITTATDVNNVTAFDVFAADNDCAIENRAVLKYVGSELVNGGSVGLYTDCGISGSLPSNIARLEAGQEYPIAVILSNRLDIPVKAEKMLILRPGNLFLGIGCKKGKSRDEIGAAVMAFLKENRRSLLSVRKIASIDLKAGEAGIVDFCGEQGIEFVTYPAEAIKTIEDKFAISEFVRKTTGVGTVAEACAVLAGGDARLVCPKRARNGITLALAEEERSYRIE